jgi:NCAIR mutase (PurE)-related protein
MSPAEALRLLDAFQRGETPRDEVLRAFQAAPVSELGFAAVDLHRELRKGVPEVIFGAGKTPAQVVAIAAKITAASGRVLVTRIGPEHARAFRRRFPRSVHHEAARCLVLEKTPPTRHAGLIAIVCAGTSDVPVAEEAAVTAEFLGHRVSRIYDVGVAGLHRLLCRLDDIQQANVVIVIAGMEAALASVLGGLIAKPLIGVPTSVGYGTNLGGLTALLGMLNSCASGLTVVNIDNGFGAGYAAAQINALASS